MHKFGNWQLANELQCYGGVGGLNTHARLGMGLRELLRISLRMLLTLTVTTGQLAVFPGSLMNLFRTRGQRRSLLYRGNRKQTKVWRGSSPVTKAQPYFYDIGV